jgi:uncharacterized membrane protein
MMEEKSLGRSGGSGGRSSGGSFGGSRSSGGRSGGSFGVGRSSKGTSGGSIFSGSNSRTSSGGIFGGGSTRPSGGGIFGGGNPRPSGGGIFGGGIPTGPIGGNRPSRSSRGGGGGCGCLVAIIVLIIVIILFSALTSNFGSLFSRPETDFEITKSTIQREALPKGSVNETDYYYDELDWIGNETKLLSGLRYFYQKTGVQPFLYITDNVNGSNYPSMSQLDDFANGLYDELFTDEAHLLFVFFEYNEGYMTRYVAGTQAKTVIDTEAGDILLDFVDRNYYDDSLDDETFFSKSFSEAADRIMDVTRSPWINVMMVFGAAVIAVVLFIWWRSHKKQKDLEEKRTQEILNTPLDKFDDLEAEQLTKKYEDDNSD